jgi:hypothetical protein
MFAASPAYSTETDRNVTRAFVMIGMHLVAVIVHGAAHEHYQIPMEPWQQIFIYVVIVIAPPAAGFLLWRGRLRPGAWLLLVSMGGSLLFGMTFHFLLLGPDHVSSVNMQGWGVTFQVTAFLLAVTEAVGFMAALRVLRAKV